MVRKDVIFQPTSLAMERMQRAAVIACASMLTLGLQGEGAGATAAKRPVTATARPDPAAARAAIPSFDLVDLRNGRPVDLARLRTPGRAMLVWLWAPG